MKKNLPKVSVIIPVYNEEKYILKTLQSIIKQQYDNYEIIIVNNNSSDDTEILIRYFIAKTPTRVPITYMLEQRQGTNFARECGRKLAKGDIIALLDADCLPSYNWLSNGVETLQNNNTVAASGAYYYYDANIFVKLFSLFTQLTIFKLANYIIQKRNKGAILIGGNIFVSAYLLEGIGGFNTNSTFYGDDLDLALKLSKMGRIKFTTILTIKTSSRRFKAIGFWKVNRQYQTIFKNLVFGKNLSTKQTLEMVHPR
jgi:glycosyltransferase involved in cell wall biosynthesis